MASGQSPEGIVNSDARSSRRRSCGRSAPLARRAAVPGARHSRARLRAAPGGAGAGARRRSSFSAPRPGDRAAAGPLGQCRAQRRHKERWHVPAGRHRPRVLRGPGGGERRAGPVTKPLVVRGSLPVELALQTGMAVAESIVVRGDAAANTTEHPWSLAGETVRDVGEPLPGQRVQGALAALPGWMSEDNGLLHIRGVDDGLLYVQDGIPVYARLDRLFGMPPNPSAIASMHVMNGYIPPEFGFKSGGVVEVRTESGIATGVVGKHRHRAGGSRHAPHRRVRRRADWQPRRTDADGVGRALVTLPGSRCARELPQRRAVIEPCSAVHVSGGGGSVLRVGAGRPQPVRGAAHPGARGSGPGSAATDLAGGLLRVVAARVIGADLVASLGLQPAWRRHAERLAGGYAGDLGRRTPRRSPWHPREPERAARPAHDESRRRALGADARRALHVRRHRPGRGGGRRAQRRQPSRTVRTTRSSSRIAGNPHSCPPMRRMCSRFRTRSPSTSACASTAARNSSGDGLEPATRRRVARARRHDHPRLVPPAVPAAASRVPPPRVIGSGPGALALRR